MGSFTIALAGDTMLGRGVGRLLTESPGRPICSPEVLEVAGSADLFVLNLECCISERGQPWPEPGKAFFFRAPPPAAATLAAAGVDAVTLANNHALDFGAEALLDTVALLDEVGIAHVGAGPDAEAAWRPAVVERAGVRAGLLSMADHPRGFAADHDRPGIAFVDLRLGLPHTVVQRVADSAKRNDITLVSPHWGPNMTPGPVPEVRGAATALAGTGASLVAGHSAHVFHGVEALNGCPVLYDLGDFVDDYAVNETLRNDLGLLWLVRFEDSRPVRLDLLPLKLDYGFTTVARGADRAWVSDRLRRAVRPLEVSETDGLLRIVL